MTEENSQSLFFRPNFRISGALLAVVLICLAIGGIIFLSYYLPIVCIAVVGILLAASALFGLFMIWFQYKAYIQINELSISGHDGRRAFNYTWQELIFAQIMKPENENDHPWLVLYTQDAHTGINIDSFDKTAVWQAIETYAPPEILEPNAYKKLDQYQLLEQEINEKLNSIPLPVSVSVSIGWRVFFIIGFLFMSFCFYMSYASVPIVTYLFLFIALLCLSGIFMGTGQLLADTDIITVKKPWGTYQIHWDEVQYLEISSHSEDGRLAFYGNDKQLGFAASALWNKKQKETFLLFTNNQIETRKLEIKKSWKANFRFNKNTKVKS